MSTSISIEAFLEFALRGTPYIYVHNYPLLIKELAETQQTNGRFILEYIDGEAGLIKLWNKQSYETRPVNKQLLLDNLRERMLKALDEGQFDTVISLRKQIKELELI